MKSCFLKFLLGWAGVLLVPSGCGDSSSGTGGGSSSAASTGTTTSTGTVASCSFLPEPWDFPNKKCAPPCDVTVYGATELFCTVSCGPGLPCPSQLQCVDQGAGVGTPLCLIPCTTDCPPGLSCSTFPKGSFCSPT